MFIATSTDHQSLGCEQTRRTGADRLWIFSNSRLCQGKQDLGRQMNLDKKFNVMYLFLSNY